MTADETQKQYRHKFILVCIGSVLVVSLVVGIFWPKHNGRPPVLIVSRAELVRFVGGLPAVRWVTICASNQNDSLSLYFTSIGMEFKVTNQWLKANGTLSGSLGPGQRCENGVLVAAEADTLRVGLDYFEGKSVFRRNPWNDALSWILFRTNNRIPASLWQWLDGLRVSPTPKRVSVEVAISSKD